MYDIVLSDKLWMHVVRLAYTYYKEQMTQNCKVLDCGRA